MGKFVVSAVVGSLALGAPAVAQVGQAANAAPNLASSAVLYATMDDKEKYLTAVLGQVPNDDQFSWVTQDDVSFLRKIQAHMLDTPERWPHSIAQINGIFGLDDSAKQNAAQDFISTLGNPAFNDDREVQLRLDNIAREDRKARQTLIGLLGAESDVVDEFTARENHDFIVALLREGVVTKKAWPNTFDALIVAIKGDAIAHRQFIRQVGPDAVVQDLLITKPDPEDEARAMRKARLAIASECKWYPNADDHGFTQMPSVEFLRAALDKCLADEPAKNHPNLLIRLQDIVRSDDNAAAKKFILTESASVIAKDASHRNSERLKQGRKILENNVAKWSADRVRPYLVRQAKAALKKSDAEIVDFLDSLSRAVPAAPHHLTNRGLFTQAIRPATKYEQHALVARPTGTRHVRLIDVLIGEDQQSGVLRRGNWLVEDAANGWGGCFTFRTADGDALKVNSATREVHYSYVGASDLERNEATWCVRPSPVERGVAFESAQLPGHFLRHFNYKLYASKQVNHVSEGADFDNPRLWAEDVSWLIVDPDQEVRN